MFLFVRLYRLHTIVRVYYTTPRFDGVVDPC